MAKAFKPCSIDGCNGNADRGAGGRRGLCQSHYRYSTTGTRQCSVDGCQLSVRAKGFCPKHYTRFKKTGDVFGLVGSEPGAAGRFIRDVALPYAYDKCLIWPYRTDGDGYAVMHLDGKFARVCRVICERMHGPAPSHRHHAAHSCGKGHLGCINPKHLRWATPLQNIADKKLHGTYRCGEEMPAAKLTERDVLAIRRLKGVVTAAQLASAFDVSVSLIGDVHAKRAWRWL